MIEKFAYAFCDSATVSSSHSKTYIVNKYHIDDNKVTILFNYIDTDRFYSSTFQFKKDRLLFVGRLDKQKNLENLFLSLAKINIGIDIYGDGKLKNELISLSIKLNIDVNFYGIILNSELPEVLRQYKYYILPSIYEGMPKTLIEAMSCGLVCIGSDTMGINEIIIHNYNGYLINGFTKDDITNGITKALEQKNHNVIQANAIKSISVNFSLNHYAFQESKIFLNFNL